MHVLIFSSEFPPGPGGIGAHAYNLAHQLTENGNAVTIYTADRPDYPSHQFDSDQKMKILRYPIYLSSVARVVHLVKFMLRQRQGCDWIILSGLTNLVLYNLIKLVMKSRVLCVVHGHEIIMARGVNRFFVRRALMQSDKVVSVSDFSKRLLEQNGISRPVLVIPNGVNTPNYLQEKHRDRNRLVLITIGSVTKRKGQQNVVAALPHIIRRFENVEYHIVGIPREQSGIEALAESLGVSRYTVFHGAVSDEEKNRLLKLADVFIMLSENLPDGDVEGFGIAVLEANGFGVPALGSRGTGVEQAINDGISGYVVDAKNPIEICKHLDIILKNYDALSKQAYEWAQKHDWSIIGKQYLVILDEK